MEKEAPCRSAMATKGTDGHLLRVTSVAVPKQCFISRPVERSCGLGETMKRALQLATILVAALSAAAQNAPYSPQQPKQLEQATTEAARPTQTRPFRIAATVPALVNVSLPARNDAIAYQHLVERDPETHLTENHLGYPLGAKLGTAIRNARAGHFIKAFCKKNGNGAPWSYPFQDRLITGTCGD
jgi:hypothetical protein